MKKIEIGNIKVDLAETTGDIPARRYREVKNWLIQDESGQTLPILKEMFSKFLNEFDKDSKAGMFLAVHTYISGLQKVIDGVDPGHMAFALITFEEGEDHNSIDETLMKAKLERYYEQGLMQSTIEEAVNSFLLALISR